MLDWVQDVPLLMNTLQFLKFKRKYVEIEDKLREKRDHFNQLFPLEVWVVNRSLKQLLKVSIRCRFQEYLFRNSLQIIIKVFVAEFIFSKIPYFQHILLNTFVWIRFNYGNLSLSRSFLDLKTTFRLQKPHCENFW